VLFQHRNERRIVRHIGREGLAVGQLAFDLLVLDRNLRDLPLNRLLVELGVGNDGRVLMLPGVLEHVEQEHEQKRDQDPQRKITKVVHRPSFQWGPIRQQGRGDLPY